ncbi:amidase [Acuticoccus sediminis]|uniref:amidase n=1 Tax=Acuticoccus sediminis TaxID=2184697 RepID=UPI001CFDA017|nr:amidase [Acuticoccus sediminis]
MDTFLSAAEVAARYRDKSLSPVEFTKACLARIEALDPVITSFITLTPERALADAAAAEADFARGVDRGPMQGIPYGQKDIVETAGIRTTGQSKSLADYVPTTDAVVETKLRRAGGVLLGKTTTWEFAHGGPSWDVVAPPAANPWNPAHHPAGSSSGTGAAIAAGFMPVGIGTDTGGSIRMPAAACGTAGIKATYGRVSRRGVFPNSFSHDHVGPLAWTSMDAAMMLSVIAGFDPLDPGCADEPVLPYHEMLGGDLTGVRIGVPWHWLDEAGTPDASRAAFEEALAVLAEAGATIVPITLPTLQDFSDAKKVVAMSELYSIHRKTLIETPELLGESLRYRIQCGALIRAEDYVQATRWRTLLTRATQSVFATVDFILTPTAEPAGKLEPTPHEWLFTHKSFTTPFNTTGNPALSICNGFNEAGLPYSLQIVGRNFDEAGTLKVGHVYETLTAWRKERPKLESFVTAEAA